MHNEQWQEGAPLKIFSTSCNQTQNLTFAESANAIGSSYSSMRVLGKFDCWQVAGFCIILERTMTGML
jgi:hypothetical protein